MASEGFLDTDKASGVVTNLLTTLQALGASLTTSAQSAIGQLAVGTNLTAPFVAMPTAPASPGLASLPEAPGLSAAAMPSVAPPEAPGLESLDLPDVPIPSFTAVAPEVTIPGAPELTYPAAPGDAPSVPGVDMPADPGVALPDPPTLAAVTIPDFAGMVLPGFSGTQPEEPALEAPGRVFAYSAGVFENPLQRTLEEQIYADVLAGGNIEAIEGITAALAEVEAVNLRILRQKKTAIWDAAAARGQDAISGPDLERERLAELEYADNVRESAAKLVTEKCRMTMEYRQFLLDKGVNYIGLLLTAFNEAATRGLEAAKAAAELQYRNCEIQVQIHNVRLARYQADIALWETQFKAAQLALEERKTALEAARVRGELRKQDVDVYVAQCQAQLTVVEVFKARVQAAIATLQGQVEQVHAYEARTKAYETGVNAQVAKLNAYIAQIGAQKAKVEIFVEQARAFAEQVAASKAAADIGVARAGIVNERNASAVKIFAATIDRYRADVQQAIAAVEAVQKMAQTNAQIYEANVRGVSAENEARRGIAALDVQMFGHKLTAAVEQAKINLDCIVRAATLNEESIKAAGSIAAQVAASALSGVHGTASIGFSGSNSNNSGYSVGVSTSTNTSDITTHNS